MKSCGTYLTENTTEKKKKRPNDMICALMCRSRQRAIVLWDGRKMPMDFLLTVNPKKKIFKNKSTKLSPSFPDIVCSLSGAGGEGGGAADFKKVTTLRPLE